MIVAEQNIIEIKSNLHNYIDNIDDANLLNTVYILLTPKTNKNGFG